MSTDVYKFLSSGKYELGKAMLKGIVNWTEKSNCGKSLLVLDDHETDSKLAKYSLEDDIHGQNAVAISGSRYPSWG